MIQRLFPLSRGALLRARSARLRLMYLSALIFTAVAMAPTRSANATPAQTSEITSWGITLMQSSLRDVVLLFVGSQVLSLTVFWLIVVPIHDWIVDLLVERRA